MPTRFRLDELLKAKGMTPTDLVLASQVPPGTVNAIRWNATTQLDLVILDKLAAALGVEATELLVSDPVAEPPRAEPRKRKRK